MHELVDESKKTLTDRDADGYDFGRLFDTTWKLKRQTGAVVSIDSIDGLMKEENWRRLQMLL